ncbi:MAG: TM2 domain-containing protein [bacterium]|nr:TM2 domain-containing protein [bacterium]
MDTSAMVLISMQNKFPPGSLLGLPNQLSEDQVRQVASIDYRDPVVALLLGLFFGPLGVDRFYNGDTGLALGKLFTLGGLGIWAIVDLFLIMNAVKRKNLEKLNAALGMASPNP